jgi:hypothetical protein
MAQTSNSYTGNGSTTNYSFTFPYLATTDIKAQIDGVATTAFSLANATTLQFNSAPSNGAAIIIFRETDDTSLSGGEFFSGSAIRAETLNSNFNQTLYVGQEVASRSISSLGGTMQGQLVLGKDVNLTFEGSTDDAHETTITTTNPTADRTITLPNVSGTVVTTGDTGSVSNTMLADAELQELATMSSGTASALADLSQTEVQVLDGVTSSTAELNILDGVTASTTEINKLDGVTATTAEINHVDGVTSNVQTQLNAKQPLDAELTELATMASGTASALADLNTGEVQALDGLTASTAELNKLDGVTATTDELNIINGVTSTTAELNILDGVTSTAAEINILDGVTASTAEINALDGIPNTLTATELGYVDGVTSSIQTQINGKQPLDSELTTLSGMTSATASKLAANTNLTSDIADLNQIDGLAKETTITDDDAKFPTSGAVVDYVAAQIAPLGGLEVIANEVSFPNVQPSSGVVISISDAGGVVFSGSGSSTTGRTVGGSTVTINNAPSSLNGETLVAGVGLMVSSTGSSQTYNYHKILGKEDDIKQLSDDINDFNARYRVGSSNPTSALDAGDLFFNTSTQKLLVYNATNSAWEEAQSIGNFFISTFSESFDGSRTQFTLSNAPTNAQQIILSLNGVVQKPGTAFTLSGSTVTLASAPASGSDYFAVVMGSTVNIGTPSNNTVSSSILQNGSVINAKLGDQAVTLDKLLHGDSNSNGKFLRANNGADPTFETIDLTALSAANLTSGTIPDARFPATLPAISGANLTGINTDLVADTSPQLGGDLDCNQKGILLQDRNSGNQGAIKWGDNGEMWMFHAGGDNTNRIYSSGKEYGIWSGQSNDHIAFKVTASDTAPAVELYFDNSLKLATKNEGVRVTGNFEAYPSSSSSVTAGKFYNNSTGASADCEVRIQTYPNQGADPYIKFDSGGSNMIVGQLYAGTTNNKLVLGAGESPSGGVAGLQIDGGGQITPDANNARDLGSTSLRFRNIYTNDLHLSNEGSSNDVDSTWGDWTIQEGESDLFLKNNRSGKKYKFNLTEVS